MSVNALALTAGHLFVHKGNYRQAFRTIYPPCLDDLRNQTFTSNRSHYFYQWLGNQCWHPMEKVKFTFSGHDSFQCRQLWLKKGFDFVSEGRNFNEESAVVELGVGKNMVSSIRYWLKAFGITGENDAPTEFGRRLLNNENGWDPYLEDEASLWLLHYRLVTTGVASSYSIIFNEFRRERIEFTRKHYVDFIARKSQTEATLNFNERTIGDDFEVFRKLYLRDEEGTSLEDSFAGVLSDLNILGIFRKVQDGGKPGKSKERTDAYYIENKERPELPLAIFLYAILDEYRDISISLNNLSSDLRGPGSIFALSRTGIWDKVHKAAAEYPYVKVQDYAGVQELQFTNRPDPLTILERYYGR